MIEALKLREKIASGRGVFGTLLCESESPGVAQILSNAGFDFIVIDCEHGSYSSEQASALISSAHEATIAVLVRVPLDNRGMVTQVLDAGADGILFPQSRSLNDVRLAIDWSKYPPEGQRGVHMFRPHTHFNPPADSFEYMKKANRSLITAIQIENPQITAEIDEIVSMKGVDMVYIGPSDLKANLSCGGESVERVVRQIRTQTINACKRAGKIAGSHCAIEDITNLRREGFSVLGYAAASRLLATGAEDFIKQARKAENKVVRGDTKNCGELHEEYSQKDHRDDLLSELH